MSHTCNLVLNNQSLSRILYFKSSFVTILLYFSLIFFVQPPRKVCIANRNIGQKFVFSNKYISVILASVVYSYKLVTPAVGISLPSVFHNAPTWNPGRVTSISCRQNIYFSLLRKIHSSQIIFILRHLRLPKRSHSTTPYSSSTVNLVTVSGID